MDLMADLGFLTGRWLEEERKYDPDRDLSTLGFRVAKSTSLFRRLDNGGALTVPLWERFVSYLADGRNWPEKRIPEDVVRKLAILGADLSAAVLRPDVY